MGNGLYGVEHSFFPSSLDVVYSEMCYFMENVTGYPWVVEEVSAKEKIYYIDDSRNIGLSVYNTGNYNTAGIYITKDGVRSTAQLPVMPKTTGTQNKYYLYFAQSDNNDVFYLASCISSNATSHMSMGVVAAKDINDNWAIFYNSSQSPFYDTVFQCDKDKIDRAVKIGVCGGVKQGNPYNPDSYFSFVKCPNVFAGVEFKSLYLVLSSPTAATIEQYVGLGKVFATVEGKTLRLVPLYGGYVAFAFPVSE